MPNLRVPISSEDHVLGGSNALITFLEYGDYECSRCKEAHSIVKEIQNHFGGQLRFIFRHFSLKEVHPHAELAAETAEFASTKGKFWEMQDLIYANQDRLSIPLMIDFAQKLNLPERELEEVLKNKVYEAKIRKDFMGGVRSGVNGTPTFFINDQRYDGPHTYEALVAAIDKAITR